VARQGGEERKIKQRCVEEDNTKKKRIKKRGERGRGSWKLYGQEGEPAEVGGVPAYVKLRKGGVTLGVEVRTGSP